MEILQVREKEIFEMLKKLRKFNFVLIGGYAVNSYTLPRFSVDCDIVINNMDELNKILKELEDNNYIREEIDDTKFPYRAEFRRYVKKIGKNINVSFDLLINKVLDRRTGAEFSADWVFENSSKKYLRGKTIKEELELRIINLDALAAMKFVACRGTDMRDIFMLLPKSKNLKWIKDEASMRCDFLSTFNSIKNKIISKKFKDDLQGVYGYIDENTFQKHKNSLLKLEY